MAAPVYVGNTVESGMGGGICQVSSTLYSALLYANLEILERHNHSLRLVTFLSEWTQPLPRACLI